MTLLLLSFFWSDTSAKQCSLLCNKQRVWHMTMCKPCVSGKKIDKFVIVDHESQVLNLLDKAGHSEISNLIWGDCFVHIYLVMFAFYVSWKWITMGIILIFFHPTKKN